VGLPSSEGDRLDADLPRLEDHPRAERQRREPSLLIAMELVEEDCLQLGRLVGGEVVLLRLVPLACIALGDLVVQVAGIPPGAS